MSIYHPLEFKDGTPLEGAGIPIPKELPTSSIKRMPQDMGTPARRTPEPMGSSPVRIPGTAEGKEWVFGFLPLPGTTGPTRCPKKRRPENSGVGKMGTQPTTIHLAPRKGVPGIGTLRPFKLLLFPFSAKRTLHKMLDEHHQITKKNLVISGRWDLCWGWNTSDVLVLVSHVCCWRCPGVHLW